MSDLVNEVETVYFQNVFRPSGSDVWLEAGPNLFHVSMQGNPRMGKFVGAESSEDADAKYRRYFGIIKTTNKITVLPANRETVIAAKRQAGSLESFMADCTPPVPISTEALPLIADWLDERNDPRGPVIREIGFQLGVQERC